MGEGEGMGKMGRGEEWQGCCKYGEIAAEAEGNPLHGETCADIIGRFQ